MSTAASPRELAAWDSAILGVGVRRLRHKLPGIRIAVRYMYHTQCIDVQLPNHVVGVKQIRHQQSRNGR